MPTIKPIPMTPASAVKFLQKYLITPGSDAALIEPFGLLIDHVTRLEQALELIELGVQSALRDRPNNAVMPSRKDGRK